MNHLWDYKETVKPGLKYSDNEINLNPQSIPTCEIIKQIVKTLTNDCYNHGMS